MQDMYYIGLDVHKRTISYCVKDASARVHAEGFLPATRFDLDRWLRTMKISRRVACQVLSLSCTGWTPHSELRQVVVTTDQYRPSRGQTSAS
jgi:transposase